MSLSILINKLYCYKKKCVTARCLCLLGSGIHISIDLSVQQQILVFVDVFCDARPDGNYRNPWNCHHFISCVAGKYVYDRLCHPLSLVYDPNNDQCEYKEKFACVQLKTSPGPGSLWFFIRSLIHLRQNVFSFLDQDFNILFSIRN